MNSETRPASSPAGDPTSHLPHQLEYARPAAPSGERRADDSARYVGQMMLGCVTVPAASVVIGAGLWALSWVSPLGTADYVFVAGGGLSLLIVLGVMARVRWRWQGFLVGVLIAILIPLGLLLLLWELCGGPFGRL